MPPDHIKTPTCRLTDDKFQPVGAMPDLVATALISRLRRLAKARGAWVIHVQPDHGDAPAIALYTSLGTRKDVAYFDIAPD